MDNYVISLKTEAKRREHIVDQFTQQSIPFNFFDALTPTEAVPFAAELGLDYDAERLTNGELACFMSHVSLWKKMVDENIPYMAIFEDDIYLGEDSSKFLNSSDWINKNWHVIKIEAFAKKAILGSTLNLTDSHRSIAELKTPSLGTAGYILSYQGAKKYLDFISNNQLIPLDEMMFSAFLNQKVCKIYQMNAALCIQEMLLFPESQQKFVSDLLVARKQRMKKFKKKGIAKLQHEVQRIINQLNMSLFGKEITFK